MCSFLFSFAVYHYILFITTMSESSPSSELYFLFFDNSMLCVLQYYIHLDVYHCPAEAFPNSGFFFLLLVYYIKSINILASLN